MSEAQAQDVFFTLQNDWELQLPQEVTREEIVQRLADRVVRLLAISHENFFQLMYRLDIPEDKLYGVLHMEDAPLRIANMIYDRQCEKIISRKMNTRQVAEDPELSW